MKKNTKKDAKNKNFILEEIKIELEKKSLDPGYLERVKKSIKEDFIAVPYKLKN